MRTLAFLMFVGFALLNTSHGKDAESKESAIAGITKSEVIIDKRHDDVSNVVTEPAGQTTSVLLTLWQFMSSIVNALSAFNDPSLSEYAKQQGLDVSDSLTTACPDTSQAISLFSKSLSSQSSKP